jgi:hypothetical protein
VSDYDKPVSEPDLSAALIRECEALGPALQQAIENRDKEGSE